MSEVPDQSPAKSQPAWLLPTVVVGIVALIAIGAVLFNAFNSGDEQAEPAPETSPVVTTETPQEPGEESSEPVAEIEDVETEADEDLRVYEARDPDDLLAVGPVDAPVGMVVFSDYQCKFCAKWSAETLPVMMEHVEAGELRIEFRDVNIFGDASERAALASYAAAKQDRFMDFHSELFPNGDVLSERALSDESLLQIAEELGLDVEQFEADRASDEAKQVIQRNEDLGVELGAFSTPAFLLGGEPILGAQPTEVFEATFAEVLAKYS